ncbi:MAG: serine protease [Alphaproteobacteria bacterium]|nr:serine protease [Alphaproteobacteria bacterium]
MFRLALVLLLALAMPAHAQPADDVLATVVRIEVKVPPTARSAATLGTERRGHGVVIRADGLIVTIGYLVQEASEIEVTGPSGKPISATLVGYDYESGFGLVRTAIPIAVKPIELGDSAELAERQQVLVATYGGYKAATAAMVVSRRTFAGYWEYLLENAIFTSPPISEFGGAALFASDGRLAGIGSLYVGDAYRGSDRAIPGNMFVPIDRLKPILDEMVKHGRPQSPPKPWLGLTSEEHRGRVIIVRVAPDSPAARIGLKPGDLVLSVAGQPVGSLESFYRRIFAVGPAGTEIPLKVLHGHDIADFKVPSADRHRYIRSGPTY